MADCGGPLSELLAATALPAGVLAARRHGRQLPAVLQHRWARRRARGGSRGVRPDPRAHRGALRRRKDRRCPRRPHRRPVGPGAATCTASARARSPRPAPVVLVEKILDRDEVLDGRWPVDGTTGYEFADRAGGLFLEETGCRQLSDIGSSSRGGRYVRGAGSGGQARDARTRPSWPSSIGWPGWRSWRWTPSIPDTTCP